MPFDAKRRIGLHGPGPRQPPFRKRAKTLQRGDFQPGVRRLGQRPGLFDERQSLTADASKAEDAEIQHVSERKGQSPPAPRGGATIESRRSVGATSAFKCSLNITQWSLKHSIQIWIPKLREQIFAISEYGNHSPWTNNYRKKLGKSKNDTASPGGILLLWRSLTDSIASIY